MQFSPDQYDNINPVKERLGDLIGKVINFECQPYQQGTAKITDIKVEERDVPGGYKGYLILEVETIEATETSRLGWNFLSKPFNGKKLRMYYYREERIRDAVESGRNLIYVYPV